MAVDQQLLSELEARGLVNQMTSPEELAQHLQSPRTLYCGFDPTADSLHIGSLVPLLTLKRFQLAGHTPVVLVGGATGLVGDPSFKAQERKLNSAEVVADWVEKLKRQTSAFVDFDGVENPAIVVNNLDWTADLNVLDFLRDIGKHFSVNNMINKESVKQRLAREDSGISFTEFTYMLLQSMDFAELYRRHNCSLQIGGSDQWGNIVGGVDLCRKLHAGHAFGLTLPLVTKSDGAKFGKTESGTIWLDARKTSPYAFYQFWLSTADADVYKFLRYFTFLSPANIEQIEGEDKANAGKPQAQGVLAREVTRLVHGQEALESAERITQLLFKGGQGVVDLTEGDLEQLRQDGLPSSDFGGGQAGGTVSAVLTEAGLAGSGKQVMDALGRQAVEVNGVAIGREENSEPQEVFSELKALHGRFHLVKFGKKKYHLFERV